MAAPGLPETVTSIATRRRMRKTPEVPSLIVMVV
jgi:hypothetical protein